MILLGKNKTRGNKHFSRTYNANYHSKIASVLLLSQIMNLFVWIILLIWRVFSQVWTLNIIAIGKFKECKIVSLLDTHILLYLIHIKYALYMYIILNV